MTLQRLACFVQVADCLNFCEAAQNLHIAQPSLSRQIVSLEDELGLKLFERNTRKVSLTPAGRELAAEAREVLKRANNLHMLAQRLSTGYNGKLNVGYSSSMDGSFLAQFLESFRDYQPRLELILHRVNQGRLITSLKNGELDAALLFRNGMIDKSGLKMITVAQSKLSLVLPQGHPLTARDSVSIPELSGLPLHLMDRSESAGAHDHFLALCQRHGVIPNLVRLSDDPQVTMLSAVSENEGTVCPLVSGKDLPYGLISIPLISDGLPVVEDVVVAYNNDFQSEAIAFFLSQVRRYAGKTCHLESSNVPTL